MVWLKTDIMIADVTTTALVQVWAASMVRQVPCNMVHDRR